jgi:hypothetical protein
MMNAQSFRRSVLIRNINAAAAGKRKMGLGQLVAFRQIRIIIDLLIKGTFRLQIGASARHKIAAFSSAS